MDEKFDVVILAGGRSLRLKPFIWIDKPFLPLTSRLNLLEFQIGRLLNRKRIGRIVVTVNERHLKDLNRKLPVDYVLEEKELGTGGAVKNVLSNISSRFVYVLNVDDIVLDENRDPDILLGKIGGNTILLSHPQLPFGVVRIEGNRIVRFEEKPTLDLLVSIGHYVLERKLLEKLEEEGNIEDFIEREILKNEFRYILVRRWITVSNLKDYLTAREILSKEDLSREEENITSFFQL